MVNHRNLIKTIMLGLSMQCALTLSQTLYAQEAPASPNAATQQAGAKDHGPWQIDADLKDVFAQAKRENKDVVVKFTGSDWCPPCIALDKSILSQKEFQDAVTDDFILVKLDYPRQKSQSPEVKQRNAEAQQKYRIEGYPTLILFDQNGTPYGQTGYQPISPEKYAQHLYQLRESRLLRDRILDEAEKLQGTARAEKLDEAINVIGIDNAALGMRDQIKEISELDANNEAGLKEKYASILQNMKWEEAMQRVMMAAKSGDLDEALIQLQVVFNDDPPAEADKVQEMYMLKAQLLVAKGDNEAVIKAVEDAIEAAPNSQMAPQLRAALDNMKKSLDKNVSTTN
ncbi:Disulfide bond reductase DsbH precursor [Poriferisphaera corsica]|uniref:Disulfide bond reductase DsbH n=1 Tax=Poriferisphaera corsica TaxID=2528020 RepID=A0A517YT74_9BACT|nr:thioredoxin fold domain-containing protein [Poriferisphaera corsica]QDU33428.1 Disulfide bond reductase DsbH precursor [Poriferisphaera corsica]